nr:hypothetical protein [uncultured Oscillibacter sp.]
MVDSRKLRPGMKVRIVGDPADVPHIDPDFKMGKWCGQIVTVLSVSEDSIKIVEDAGDGPEEQGGHWFWYDGAVECIAKKEPNYPDFDVASKNEILSFIFGN